MSAPSTPRQTPTTSTGGGFLPTPTPSDHTPSHSTPLSPSSSISGTILPAPRSTPLRPGSAKEATLRRYVEDQLLHISGRYERRFSRKVRREREPEAEAEDAEEASNVTGSGTQQGSERQHHLEGYESYAEAAKDLKRVLDVVWVSGTASLQIPFLFNISLSASEYLSSFPLSPTPTFTLFRALDHAWASLLSGEDFETHAPLPMGRRLTTTEKVRLKGIAENTRVRVVKAASGGASVASRVTEVEDEESSLGMDTDTDADEMRDVQLDGGLGAEDPADLEMGVARVYELTIVELGNTLGGAEVIGIQSDERYL